MPNFNNFNKFSLFSKNLLDISFRFGINDRNNPESWSTIRTVSQMIIHPAYNKAMNWTNDIALFKLRVNCLLNNYRA